MDISIVIPAYEESGKIGNDIKRAAEFIESNNLKGEIIVVDDGSRDNTADAAKNVNVPKGITVKVERYEHHRGKGNAICTGVKQTQGEYVMFADSGSCVPYGEVLRGLKMLKSGACDIAHGSRKLPESQIVKSQSWYRRICSAIFHWFVIYFMKIPAELTDTQCGFKIYNGQIARSLYGQCITGGFMFDVEIIIRAIKEGYRIKEFPIQWTCDRDSRLSPTRSVWNVFGELINIKKNLKK